jgi:hemerythrin-like metal-binding protein
MQLITWDDEIYGIRIAEIDEQHKQIFQLLNDLHDALMARKNKQVTDEIFTNLAECLRSHFINEETLLHAHGYPALRDHKRHHDEFVIQLNSLQKQLQSGKFAIGAQTRDFLRNWVIIHIRSVDHQYGSFLRMKGLE